MYRIWLLIFLCHSWLLFYFGDVATYVRFVFRPNWTGGGNQILFSAFELIVVIFGILLSVFGLIYVVRWFV